MLEAMKTFHVRAAMAPNHFPRHDPVQHRPHVSTVRPAVQRLHKYAGMNLKLPRQALLCSALTVKAAVTHLEGWVSSSTSWRWGASCCGATSTLSSSLSNVYGAYGVNAFRSEAHEVAYEAVVIKLRHFPLVRKHQKMTFLRCASHQQPPALPSPF